MEFAFKMMILSGEAVSEQAFHPILPRHRVEHVIIRAPAAKEGRSAKRERATPIV